jgi:hypothetical protein
MPESHPRPGKARILSKKFHEYGLGAVASMVVVAAIVFAVGHGG